MELGAAYRNVASSAGTPVSPEARYTGSAVSRSLGHALASRGQALTFLIAARPSPRRTKSRIAQLLHRRMPQRTATAKVSDTDDKLRLDPLRVAFPQGRDRRSVGAQAGQVRA
jgi:hypothetical protein